VSNKKIGATIITFNNISDTLYAIDSFLNSDYKNIELLVIDNKSDEIYKNKLASEVESKFPKVKLLYINEDKGYGGACNIGAKYLIDKGSEVLLFLNNDVFLEKSCVSRLAENLSNNIVLTGPKLYFGFSKILYCAGGFFDKNLIIKNRGCGEIDKGQYDKKEEIEFINGSVFMIDAAIFMKLGGFDENFYYYCDETDLCYRILKAGYKIIYEPQAQAYHYASKTLGQGSKRSYYFLARSTLHFTAKHGKSRGIFLRNLCYIVYNFLMGFTWNKIKQVYAVNYAVIKGIADFIRGRADKGPY
jgi:GT2 family glycosyltransferase